MRIRQTKPKGVTTQQKALDEYILMALFVILLKRVNLLLFWVWWWWWWWWWCTFHNFFGRKSIAVKGFISVVTDFLFNLLFQQKLYRLRRRLREPEPGVLFFSANRATADEDFVYCMKYLFNKFFFHFGWEVFSRILLLLSVCTFLFLHGILMIRFNKSASQSYSS